MKFAGIARSGGRHVEHAVGKKQPDLGPPPEGAKMVPRGNPHGARIAGSPYPKPRAKLKRLLIPLGGKPENTAGLNNIGRKSGRRKSRDLEEGR